MKKTLILLAAVLWLATGCQKTPTGPEPPPTPTEQLIGKLFWHDLVGGQFDIFMADLYIVPKTMAKSGGMVAVRFGDENHGRLSFGRGIGRHTKVEIDGNVIERVVVNAFFSLQKFDLSQYDFVLRNTETLTDPSTDDFAVAVNSRNWIAYVRARDYHSPDVSDWQIIYMDIADRIPHQLTPLNGQYSGTNCDPDWKNDYTIVWVHGLKAVEVNLNNLNSVTDSIPDWNGAQYDPNYSPDGSMILFNTWQNGKKNGYIKYILTGVFEPVLPQSYFNLYVDDNPTWVLSNSRISGHLFMDKKGHIYIRDLQTGAFSIITDNQHDFRYVTPLKIGSLTYLVFSDWTDRSRPKLWICDETGTDLRELNQTGDEAVFLIMGFPVPQSREDLEQIARDYSLRFSH